LNRPAGLAHRKEDDRRFALTGAAFFEAETGPAISRFRSQAYRQALQPSPRFPR
jgi:hypothetical protein